MNESEMLSSTERTAERTAARRARDAGEFGSESDIVSFWLLLLFVAVFFGIAAEEAHGPLFTSSTRATQAPLTLSDVRTRAARDFDLTSRSRPEKTEVPATGK